MPRAVAFEECGNGQGRLNTVCGPRRPGGRNLNKYCIVVRPVTCRPTSLQGNTSWVFVMWHGGGARHRHRLHTTALPATGASQPINM